uniref:T cell receptor beta variable 30 n=1 Tax=Prolemur simus TaxID=1328070 RepID=A0A8C8YBG3_PROSS
MLCSLLALLLGTLLAQTIQQWPAVRVQPVGSPLSLKCTVKGTSSPTLFWYRQAAGGPLQLLFYSVGINDTVSEEPLNLSASRPEDGQFILRSEKLLLSHSAFYLCAWSITLSRAGPPSVQKPHCLLSPSHPPLELSLRGWVDDICDWVSDC